MSKIKVKTKESGKKNFADLYSKYGIFVILIIAVIIAAFLSDTFLTPRNLSNIIRQNSVVMIIAFGAQMVLITGEVDLSPGSVCAFSGIISTMVMLKTENAFLALLAGILVGAAFGFLNGLVITTCGIPAFIMTLASQFIGRGAVQAITNSQPVRGFDKSYTVFGQGRIGLIPVPILVINHHFKWWFVISPIRAVYLRA